MTLLEQSREIYLFLFQSAFTVSYEVYNFNEMRQERMLWTDSLIEVDVALWMYTYCKDRSFQNTSMEHSNGNGDGE